MRVFLENDGPKFCGNSHVEMDDDRLHDSSHVTPTALLQLGDAKVNSTGPVHGESRRVNPMDFNPMDFPFVHLFFS